MTDYTQDPNPILIPAPPSSVEAERSVIGAAMQNGSVVPLLADSLTPDDFFSPEHKAMFTAILGLYTAGKPVDLMTLGNALQESGTLDAVGGAKYLLDCVRFVPTTANTKTYVAIVKEKSNLRRLINAASEIQKKCYAQTDPSDDILSSAEMLLSSCTEGVSEENKPKKLKEFVAKAFDKIELNARNGGKINGVPTGFYDLDRMLTGLHPGELIIVGGRPAMGKTAFALSVAHFASVQSKKKVVFFSLEMPGEQLAIRLIALQSRVKMQKMRNGTLSTEDWEPIGDALNELSIENLLVDDTPAITPSKIKSRIKALQNTWGKPDLVLVDYLGIVSADQKSENRQNEVSEITRQFKAMARELETPFVVLAQLSRANASRSDKKPVLTDIRETGNIEAEADVVVFVHRDGYYDSTADQNEGTFIVAKQRNGPVGEIGVAWNAEMACYQNKPDTLKATYK